MKRELSEIYFPIETEEGEVSICFEDMKEEQQDKFLKDKGKKFLKILCKDLASVIREIGDQLNLKKES